MSPIPNDAKSFYKSLIGDPTIEEDIDGFNGELDFDLEEDVLWIPTYFVYYVS